MNLLLMDPSANRHDTLRQALRLAGHTLTQLGDEAALAAALEMFHCDAVLVNVKAGFNEDSSLNALRWVRKTRANLPLIVLSNRIGIVEHVKLLGLDADDYILAPWHSEELLARLVITKLPVTLNS